MENDKNKAPLKKPIKNPTPWQQCCTSWAMGWPPASESCSDFSDLFQFWQERLFYSPAAECTNETRDKDSWAKSSESLVETLRLSAGLIKWIFRYRECFIIALTLQDRVILLLFPKWPSRHPECDFHQSFWVHLNLWEKHPSCCLIIGISNISTCTKLKHGLKTL